LKKLAMAKAGDGAAPTDSAGRGLVVKSLDGRSEVFKFENRPLQDQVQAICQMFQLEFDNEDNYYVLTQGSSSSSVTPGAQVVRAQAQVQHIPPKMVLGLQRATDIVTHRLNELKTARSGEVAGRLRDLLNAIYGNNWLADEVIANNGIGVVLQACLRDASDEVTELAMSSLCELCPFDKARDWLEDHQEEISPAIFKQIFSVIFPRPEQSTGHRSPPRACLCVAHFFLQWFASSVVAAHSAALGSGGEGVRWSPLYPRIVRAMDQPGTDSFSEFQNTAASSLLSAMAAAAVLNNEADLKSRIAREVVDLAGEGDTEQIEEIFKEGSPCTIEGMLTSSMGVCSELAALRCAEGNGQADGAHEEEVRRLEKRNQTLEEMTAKLQDNVRVRQEQMIKMMPFMKIESAQLVETSLDGIIRSGWDSIHWKRNYNLLHYCAECIEDPDVVELVALFATDIDQADSNGKRPIDYARAAGRPGVTKVLDRLRSRLRKSKSGKNSKVY
jgi:hypothetical protein